MTDEATTVLLLHTHPQAACHVSPNTNKNRDERPGHPPCWGPEEGSLGYRMEAQEELQAAVRASPCLPGLRGPASPDIVGAKPALRLRTVP